jgi:hypothetical protein
LKLQTKWKFTTQNPKQSLAHILYVLEKDFVVEDISKIYFDLNAIYSIGKQLGKYTH